MQSLVLIKTCSDCVPLTGGTQKSRSSSEKTEAKEARDNETLKLTAKKKKVSDEAILALVIADARV